MSYRDAPWTARFAAMGDAAESKFEEVMTESGIPFVRFGLNRPQISVSSLPTRLRHTPDYLRSRDMVECKGMGRDGVLKLKVEEYNCLNFWHQVHPVTLFVWDSHKKEHVEVLFPTITEWINGGALSGLGHFDQNTTSPKAYFAFPRSTVFREA